MEEQTRTEAHEERPTYGRDREGLSLFSRRALEVIVLVVLALALWQIVDALLLAFAGVLVAVFLRGFAQTLSGHTSLSMRWSLVAVGVILLVLIALSMWFLGPRVAEQFNELAETLPQTVEELRQNLQQHGWGRYLVDQASSASEAEGGGGIFSRITGMASSVFGVLTNIVLTLFIGIFFAANPGLYKRGVVLLVSPPRRERVEETLDTAGNALWKWLQGQFVAMLFVGVSTTIALVLLGVPMALALGVMAGLFDFVPIVGPVAAAVPGILLALTESPTLGLYTALAYLAVQQMESNVVTPLVQREAVSLPPVLVVLATVAGGLLFGVLGIILATPLLVILLVMIKMLYIEDKLGDSVDVPGR